MDQILERDVKDAAAALDKDRPGWRAEINPARLDMWSMHHCVLGQLYGNLMRGEHILQEHAHAFKTPESVAGREYLRSLWIAETVPEEPEVPEPVAPEPVRVPVPA